MYLTYDTYLEYGGTLEEATFNFLEIRAELLINWVTFNRLSKDVEYPEQVKRCVFELIDLLHKESQALSLGQALDGTTTSAIASQSNDGVSISYNALSASQALDILKSKYNDIIHLYLQGVTNSIGHKLLYRGVYHDE